MLGSRLTRLKAVVLPLLFLISACGGSSHYYVKGESNTESVKVTAEAQGSLSAMELGIFDTFTSSENCTFSAATHLWEVASAVDDINTNLYNLSEFSPPVNSVVLQSGPPRETGSVAVYICDEIGYDAYTLYRSVFISNRFLDEIKSTAEEWGDVSIFDSAVAYVIYHEVGHAALNHSAVKLSPEGDEHSFDLPQELDADRFAYDLLELTGRNLIGMVMVQSMNSQLEDNFGEETE